MNVTLSPHHGLPGMAHSSAARAAVENLTRVLSIEWARFGIRLTAVAAGHFATETLRTKYPKPVVEGVAGTVPLGRLGTEEEFAWLVAYLASPAGDYFSGAVLTIDGARDNWFGSWPPAGVADQAGQAARGGAPAEAVKAVPELRTERLLLLPPAIGVRRHFRGNALARSGPANPDQRSAASPGPSPGNSSSAGLCRRSPWPAASISSRSASSKPSATPPPPSSTARRSSSPG